MIDLHAHDTFSMRDGYGTPEQIVGNKDGSITGRLEELGREIVCITNHDNVYAFPFYNELCKSKTIKPIFGCEIRIIPTLKENTRKKYHLTLLSQTVEGYKNLQRLVTAAHSRECFYYYPTIDLDMLQECSDGLVVLSGCMSSLLSSYILNNDLVEALKLAKWFKNVFGDRYYLEVMPHDMEETQILAPALRAISKKLDIPMVLTDDVHYLRSGQDKVWKMLMCIKYGDAWNGRESGVLKNCYYMEDDEAWIWANNILADYFTEDELYKMFSNQEKIASDGVGVEIPKPGNVLCGVEHPLELLRQRSYDGLRRLNIEDNNHIDRLERELDMIARKGFTDYFIIISDMVRRAKEKDINVGPSRGSVACSLVANCIDITCVDPLEYDLTMERFLSEERVDPPDIDIDFSRDRRDEVINDLRNTFGDGNVAKITTFGKFAGRSSLDDVGKVFSVPIDKIKQIKDVLIERASADARASATIEDTLSDFSIARKIVEEYPEIRNAIYLEGQVRQTGVHAAGVVVSSTPLVDTIATIEKETKDEGRVQVTSLDGWGIQWLGLLKIDVLGLENLDMLHEMSEDTGIYDIYNLPLDDSRTLDIFNGDTLGVFQFGATGTASICRQISTDSFDDVVLINALSRPGPLHTGSTQQISEAKRNGTKKYWDMPLLDEITGSTYGFSVFQEQVLRIMHEYGGLNWEEVAKVRNAMSKSLGDEFFDTFRRKFIDGAVRLHDADEEFANNVFDHVATFGSWAFNRAHSVGYSKIAWATAFFKAHYPREFFKVLCSHSDGEQLKTFLREFKERGLGEILPPKIGKSDLGWMIEGDNLRAGLKSVLPENAAKMIVHAYPVESPDDLANKVQRRTVNSRVWGLIEQHKLFEEDDSYDPFGLYAFTERMGYVTERTDKIGDLGYLFEGRNVVLAGVLDRQINEKSLMELEQSSKLKDWRKRFDERWGDSWAIIYLRDESGICNVEISNKLYPEVKDFLWSKKVGEDILVVKGFIPGSTNYVRASEIFGWNDRKALNAKCYKCSLIHSDFCPVKINRGAKLVLLGMCPGANEIEDQEYFTGRAGEVLNGILVELGINRNDDCHVTNSCMCRATDENGRNRDPDDVEIDCCSERLFTELRSVSPKVVIPLGRLAYKALTGEGKPIGEVVGERLDMQDWICIPAYHPASTLYAGGERNRESIKASIKYAMELANDS